VHHKLKGFLFAYLSVWLGFFCFFGRGTVCFQPDSILISVRLGIITHPELVLQFLLGNPTRSNKMKTGGIFPSTGKGCPGCLCVKDKDV
jgi:hypothetical protein